VAKNFVVSDSQTLLLGDTALPAGNYLHLYDSSPYSLISSHIVAKIPCNEDFTTPIVFLFGPDNPAPIIGLALSPLLSEAGDLCTYTGDIVSNNSTYFTDIAIYNNSTEDIVFPQTSTIHIRVNEVSPQLNNTTYNSFFLLFNSIIELSCNYSFLYKSDILYPVYFFDISITD
jgi:hypothetical protein